MDNEQYKKKAAGFFNDEGLLVKLPGKRPVRMIVLAKIADRFEFGRDYTEKEVNSIIKSCIAFEDIETVRRELYDMYFLGRERDGSRYWREK